MSAAVALDVELGRQRIEELRALAEQTPPRSVYMPDGRLLALTAKWDEPYVMLPARELLAMLDRLAMLVEADRS